jgi:predicted MFS family arabinose efflux permease
MLGRIGTIYKNAFSGLPRNNWLLGVVLLINRSGTMVVPFMSVYLTKELHYDIAFAGIAMMCYGAGSIAGGYLGGKMSDKFGFYPVMFWTLFSSGLLFIILGQTKSITHFCIITFVLSLVGEAFRPANASAIAYYSTPEKRTRSYSVHRLAVNLGWGIGLAVGGLLASIDYRLIFWVDGATCILAAIFLILFLKKPEGVHITQTQDSQSEFPGSAYRDKPYLFFIIIVVVYAFCFFQMTTTMPLYYKEIAQLSEKQFGIILSINGIMIGLIEMALIYLLEGRRNGFTYISFGVILLGFSFLMLNLFPSLMWVMVLSMIILTLGEMFSLPFMNTFWIARSQQHNRGQYAGLYTMAWSAAQVLAPILGTQVVKHFGYSILWYIVCFFCLIVLFAIQLLRKKAPIL